MRANDPYLKEVEAAEEAASVVSEEIAATMVSRLPPFQKAIVVPEELPELPAQIVEGILRETHKLLLTGPPKANKTWCLINLAVSVATGSWWIDFHCAKRRVLYIDLETDVRSLQRRISTVAAAKGANPAEVRENLDVWPLRGMNCSLAQIAGELFERAKAGEYGMLIIDPAYMVQDGDENNAKDIRVFFALLDHICVRLGCTMVISHHHSKGAQGLKSAIDRGSGSGVFGRAPDAVLDMTELVLDSNVLSSARESYKLAENKCLSGWRMSFTLREFAPKDELNLWFSFPLHTVDSTGLLEDCKPNYGGLSEARKIRIEAENLGKVASLDAVCEKELGCNESCLRDTVQDALGWSKPTIREWLKRSKRFMGVLDRKTGRALIVRRPKDDAATMGLPEDEEGDADAPETMNDAATLALSGPEANRREGVQGVLPEA